MSEPGAGRLLGALSWAGVPEDLAPTDREELLRHGDRSLARRAVDDTAAYLILCAALVFTTPVLHDHTILAIGTILGFAAIGGARFVLSRSFEKVYDRAPDQWRKTFGITTLGLAGLWALFSFTVASYYGLQIPSLLVMFATAALSAAAVSALCSNRRLLTAFLLLMLTPIAIAAALPGLPQSYTMSLVVALYTAVLVQEGRFQSRHYWTAVGNEFRLRARTAEVEKARAQAEGASRAKSDFLAHMSHEIRTPLNGLLGMLYLMLETPLSKVQREYADMIQRSAESLLGVLNEILDLSKIEAGRMTLETVDFDLGELVEDVGALIAPGAYAKGVEVAVRVPPGFPRRLRGDAKRLREVLTNLASNAAKFTEKGEVALEVELVEPSDARAAFRITVRDTGIGIPLDRQAAVFQGFTQAEGSTFRRFGGTGLGLAISKQLLSLMGGTLALESEPGRGTTFRIDLALEKAPPDPAERAQNPRLRGVRVLAVDDNATSLRVLEEQLGAMGCEVETAASGAAALGSLAISAERSPYSLVLLDAALPETGGVAVARAMRADPRFLRIPIVLLQGAGEVDSASERPGAPASVTKPVRFQHLLRAIITATGSPAHLPAAPPSPRADAMSLAKLGLRVLFAEDHTVNQAVAVRMCERMGVVADVAANGREAVAAVGRRHYDAVLMDLEMPEMDGLEATREIRRIERERGGHLPIVALTGHAMATELERCREAGMDDCISKPVHPDELLRALRKWCAPGTADLPGREAAAPEEAQVLDIEQLRRVAGDDVEFERQLRDDFVASLPLLLAEAEAALSGSDGARLRALAHRLKGSSRTIGGSAVGDACEALEKAAERGGLEGAAPALRNLRAELARLAGALRSRDLRAA